MIKTFCISEDDGMTQYKAEEQICSAIYQVGEIEIKARLIARRVGLVQQYSIMLEQGGECTVCEIGSDPMSARKLFFDVVFGGVTACTLADVVEDLTGTLF